MPLQRVLRPTVKQHNYFSVAGQAIVDMAADDVLLTVREVRKVQSHGFLLLEKSGVLLACDICAIIRSPSSTASREAAIGRDIGRHGDRCRCLLFGHTNESSAPR
jgi:hypothetical protein